MRWNWVALGATVILAAVVAAWSLGYLVGEQEAATADCAFAAPPGYTGEFHADFNGWSWTCVYGDGERRVEQRGPSVWDYVRGAATRARTRNWQDG